MAVSSFFLAILAVVAFVVIGGSCMECNPSTPDDPNNIMCYKNKQCANGKNLIRSGPIVNTERTAILHFHNTLRQMVASGNLQLHPSAKTLLQISWDDKLEEAASIYAAQCQDPKAKKAAMAYKDDKYDDYTVVEYIQGTKEGDLIMPFYIFTSRDIFAPVCEKRFGGYNVEHISFSHKTKTWAQILYQNFTSIGCGYSQFNKSETADNLYTFYVCFYGGEVPASGLSLYDTGTPDCKISSTVYPGLCSTAEIEEKSESDPCADSGFALRYSLLCNKEEPLWFCDNEERKRLEETFPVPTTPRPADEEQKMSLVGTIALWSASALMGGSAIGSAAWYFWDDIVEFADGIIF